MKTVKITLLRKYFTENSVDVTKRIESLQTFLFEGEDAKQKADEKAREIRSYVYEVYKEKKRNRLEFAGYAVPK